MRKIRIALAAGLLLSLGTVAFAVASPGQDAEIATYDFALLFNNDGGATAFCPNGSVAVGGGVGYSSASTPNLGVNVSGPANSSELTSHTRSGDTARVWNSSVYSGTGSEVDLKTFAICSRSSGAKLRVKSFKVGPVKTGGAIVGCPRHQRALGGGIGVGDGPADGVYETSSGPLAGKGGVSAANTGDVARRWFGSVYNGFGVTRRFKVLVVCARRGNARIVAAKANVKPFDAVESVAACPIGERALGGGMSVLGRPSVELQFQSNGPQGPSGTSGTTMDGDRAVYWDGEIYNRLSRTRFFKVFAICASR